MFGSFRLILALAVALAHADVSWSGSHIGVVAVVSFFLLSGYVVAGLLAPGTRLSHSCTRFYLERAARLLPLYYAFLLVGIVIAALGNITSSLHGPGTSQQIAGHLLVIPLNYYMLWPDMGRNLLLPPAWSLGLEIQFYLLAPWLLRKPAWLLGTAGVSLGISTAAFLGLLHTDWFAYRLLCGNLFIFLSGVWLYRLHHQKASPTPLLLVWTYCLALFIFTRQLGTWGTPFTFEVLLGYLLGLPALALLGKYSRKRWDDHLGQLAYGVFLGHFCVLWIFQHLGWLTAPGRPLSLYIGLVLGTAYLGHALIERPLIAYRRHIRHYN
jgi:peptidoglycan/LPS O-acetylase OafA/YrhL